MLSALRQTEVADVIDALVQAGLVEQREVDDRRPTIQMSEIGKRVMHTLEPLPASLQMSFPLAKRLAIAARGIESGDVPSKTAEDAESSGLGSPRNSNQSAQNSTSLQCEHLAERLRSWRKRISAALGIPAYRVLTNATIDRIAESIPGSTSELESISGIGPATMEQFGHDIMEIVREVAHTDFEQAESQASDPESDSPAVAEPKMARSEIVESEGAKTVEQETRNSESVIAPDEPDSDAIEITSELRNDPAGTVLSPTIVAARPSAPAARPDAEEGDEETAPNYYWTWRLFSDGYTVTQITKMRGCSIGAIVQDLAEATAAGLEIDPAWKAALRSAGPKM